MTGLPPLREAIAAAGLDARKSLGQHFLLDPNLLARIVREVPMVAGDRVLEIGPGPGGLTRSLLDAGAEVIAIERDARAIPVLQALSAHHGGRLRIVEGDALRFDHAALAGPGAHIAANLPYNIGTELLVRWLTAMPWPPWWRSATLMFQKEVADRIVAATGSAAYGRLAVLAAVRTRARIALTLPPRAFVPRPKVESALVTLAPLPMPEDVPLPRLEELTAAAFGQRRKMLRQSLKGLPHALAALAEAGIDPSRRPETLSPAEFVACARHLARLRAGARSAPADS
jgi:16S rRNA (adenine1518-N6/adenine1519-N6)-dimethyltransferase